MRVAFFEPREQVLANHRKGQLFEGFVRRLLTASGYEQIELRQKHNSLEYDVEGVNAITRRRLVGEAKALERNIEAQLLSAFVGKVVPLAAKAPLDAVFVSVSPLTPDARDYLHSVRTSGLGGLQLSFTTISGEEVPVFLRQRFGHASQDALRHRVEKDFSLQAFDAWLVTTDRDEFFVATCGPNLIETPTHFATLRTDLTTLELDSQTLDHLQLQLADLGGLSLAALDAQTRISPRAERLPSVDVGAGWFDYRFPAPPECFIGRASPLQEIATTVAEIRARSTALRSIQVLSRSGVGKSSLLLKLASQVPDAIAVTIDARSLVAPSETRLVAATFVEAVNRDLGTSIEAPRTQDQAVLSLEQAGSAVDNAERVGLVQLDQFESTLSRPAVFAAVLDLFDAASSQGLSIVWVFARKNDLSVTYDEGAQVDLERLNLQSRAIALDDFSPPESGALLNRLAEELGRPLRRELAEAISTFSAGFPWLHKRLCAHVLSMQAEGVTQQELVQQGLRAEDLFQEDMAGLKENDKALLRRIAAELPATGAELARNLDSEVSPERLREGLNEFLSQKLLRLAGDIYDTYNDVFKTYLVTNQVLFQTRYIFRVSPRAALSLLPAIAELGVTRGRKSYRTGLVERAALHF
jgi:Restriction endonuclease